MNELVLTKLRNLHAQAREVFDSNLSWETKYSLIFSKHISCQVFDLISLDYYDPDTSYQEDVMAFMNAFDEAMGSKVNV